MNKEEFIKMIEIKTHSAFNYDSVSDLDENRSVLGQSQIYSIIHQISEKYYEGITKLEAAKVIDSELAIYKDR